LPTQLTTSQSHTKCHSHSLQPFTAIASSAPLQPFIATPPLLPLKDINDIDNESKGAGRDYRYPWWWWMRRGKGTLFATRLPVLPLYPHVVRPPICYLLSCYHPCSHLPIVHHWWFSFSAFSSPVNVSASFRPFSFYLLSIQM
jgi:hypothetical protein